LGTITLGDASAGLCRGMVFAAVDYWRAGVAPPADRPAAGTHVYRFIDRADGGRSAPISA
jgi:hypothetical protein